MARSSTRKKKREMIRVCRMHERDIKSFKRAKQICPEEHHEFLDSLAAKSEAFLQAVIAEYNAMPGKNYEEVQEGK